MSSIEFSQNLCNHELSLNSWVVILFRVILYSCETSKEWKFRFNKMSSWYDCLICCLDEIKSVSDMWMLSWQFPRVQFSQCVVWIWDLTMTWLDLCNVLWPHGRWSANWTIRRHLGWVVHQGTFECYLIYITVNMMPYHWSQCSIFSQRWRFDKILSFSVPIFHSWNGETELATYDAHRWYAITWILVWRPVCLTYGTAKLATLLSTWRRNTKESTGRKKSFRFSRPQLFLKSARLCSSATLNLPNKWRPSFLLLIPTSPSWQMPWSPGLRLGMSSTHLEMLLLRSPMVLLNRSSLTWYTIFEFFIILCWVG